MVKNTVTSYGGEQGQYLSRTLITLDSRGQMTTGENESFMLGPETPDQPEIAKLVKSFEDKLNEKLRKAEKERAAEELSASSQATDHFLGSDLCVRCHTSEGKQWKTTAHSMAWQKLVDVRKDVDQECIGCHVVGYRQAGGFQSAADAPRLVNVQCESCHGMGTRHDEYSAALKVTAATCVQCHSRAQDPDFDFAKKGPMVAHGNLSGESIEAMKNKSSTMTKSGSH
jgi:hypothetical protein